MPVRRPTSSLATCALILAVEGASHADPPRTVEPPWVWTTEVASPRHLDLATLSDHEADLQRTCGRADAGLRAVALRLVERKLRDLPYLDGDELGQAQRVAGEPHVWPRAWVVSGRALDHEASRQKLGEWSLTFHEAGERRCGVAIAYGADGTEAIAAIAVDAQADLAPLPILTRVGAWLSIDAKLLVQATAARVVVIGPTGRPRTVPMQFDLSDHAHARFSPDQPGAFIVQVVADLPSGPRPVLEAEVFADAIPWTQLPDLTAPGETATASDPSDRSVLLAMVGTLRATEQLRALVPDRRLDAIALAHARRMQAARSVAHDVGDGDPLQRVGAAGLRVRECGENVAHATSVPLAHRALYASPSHRSNLLSTSFDRVGVGIVRDPDGSVWVTEELAGGVQ